MNKKILILLFFSICLITSVKAENLIINIFSKEEKGSIIIAVYSTKEKEFFGKTKVNMKGNPEHVYVGAKGMLRNFKTFVSFDGIPWRFMQSFQFLNSVYTLKDHPLHTINVHMSKDNFDPNSNH